MNMKEKKMRNLLTLKLKKKNATVLLKYCKTKTLQVNTILRLCRGKKKKDRKEKQPPGLWMFFFTPSLEVYEQRMSMYREKTGINS